MERLEPIDPAAAEDSTSRLLSDVADELGMVPNVLLTMAHSPDVLEGYVAFRRKVRAGVLGDDLRERIALAVSASNGCKYGLAQHAAMGLAAGLSDEDIADSRRASSPDRRVEAVLQFAQRVARGAVDPAETGVARLRRAGFDDRAVAEILATVALTMVENYFNKAAGTFVDYPSDDTTSTW